jgi:type VI secretion system protein ImpA
MGVGRWLLCRLQHPPAVFTVTDLEPLLAPLSPEATGPDIRRVPGDLTLVRIREFRRAEDAATSADGKDHVPNWTSVARECESALKEKTKDLELVAWLTEARTHLEGFQGLATGLDLAYAMVDRFWSGLHPGAENGAVANDLRARPLSWLGGSTDFIRAVKEIPLTSLNGRPGRTWLDLEESGQLDEAMLRKDSNRIQELRGRGVISREEWRASLKATNPEKLETLVKAIDTCRERLSVLDKVCAERFGEERPTLIKLRDLLDSAREVVAQTNGATTTNGGPGPASGEEGGAVTGAQGTGPIASREQAYRALEDAANFLRRTEPHSPVPYLVLRAVKWGGMEFDQLFQDVVKNDDAQRLVWETLGLSKPEETPQS